MEYSIDYEVYNIKELVVLNSVCKYKKAHLLADILWCDGKTIDPDILLTQQMKVVSIRQFSIE